MHKLGSGAPAEIVYDGDTVETIVQKMLSNKYLIDMRKDITKTLDEIIAEYYAGQGIFTIDSDSHRKGTPKYRFNI